MALYQGVTPFLIEFKAELFNMKNFLDIFKHFSIILKIILKRELLALKSCNKGHLEIYSSVRFFKTDQRSLVVEKIFSNENIRI